VTELDRTLSRLLGYGTAMASLITGIGVVLTVTGAGATVAEVGIAMFVALPILRLLAMVGWFAGADQRRMAAIAGLVLAIIAAGAVLGALTPGARG
jgi:uncharacterized membrane protein